MDSPDPARQGTVQWFRSAPAGVRAVALLLAGAAIAVAAIVIINATKSDALHPTVKIAKPSPVKFSGKHTPFTPATKPGVDPQLQAGVTPHEVHQENPGKGFKATTSAVVKLFEDTLGARGRGGLNVNSLVDVKCARGSCTIQYIPDGPGAGRILETQGPIWRGLLNDPHWKKATVVALRGGPDIYPAVAQGQAAAKKKPAYKGAVQVAVSCTRSAVIKVGVWGIQSAPKIKQYCRFGESEFAGH